MVDADYQQVIETSLQRFKELSQQREEIDAELLKLKQFLYAALNMIPDKQRSAWQQSIDDTVQRATNRLTSLVGATREVFADNWNMGWGIGGIKQQLEARGFDFSAYKSNPLSSISTTVRRMEEMGELVSKTDAEGVTIYFATDKLRGGRPAVDASALRHVGPATRRIRKI